MFGNEAFVKPQVGTTFALQGLIGAKAVIWNDFRWPHPPMAWGDILNMLDNEPFNVAVPKNEGSDHVWNAKNDEKVIAFLTTNVPIVYCTPDRQVNHQETNAILDKHLFKILAIHLKH